MGARPWLELVCKAMSDDAGAGRAPTARVRSLADTADGGGGLL